MKTIHVLSFIILLTSPAAFAQESVTVCDQEDGKIDNLTLELDNSIYVVETDPQTNISWAAVFTPADVEYAYYYNLYDTGSCPVSFATDVPPTYIYNTPTVLPLIIIPFYSIWNSNYYHHGHHHYAYFYQHGYHNNYRNEQQGFVHGTNLPVAGHGVIGREHINAGQLPTHQAASFHNIAPAHTHGGGAGIQHRPSAIRAFHGGNVPASHAVHGTSVFQGTLIHGGGAPHAGAVSHVVGFPHGGGGVPHGGGGGVPHGGGGGVPHAGGGGVPHGGGGGAPHGGGGAHDGGKHH